MNERKKLPLCPDPVGAVQAWIEGTVLPHRWCPPLNGVVHPYTDERSGHVDWDAVKDKIRFSNLTSLSPDGAGSMVGRQYRSFIENSIKPDALLAHLWILPDFDTNQAFDRLEHAVSVGNFNWLVQKPHLVAQILRRYSEVNGISIDEGRIRTITTSQHLLIQEVQGLCEETYGPSQFYGQPLSVRDMRELDTDRGPISRHAVLTRAPCYILQANNPLAHRSPSSEKRQAWREHNTQDARKLSVGGGNIFERRIVSYRSKK